jgi:hypothetical protein
MKTILLAYEERPVARRILERTAELAKVVVTSVAPAVHAVRVGPYDPADPPSRHREEVDSAAARLSELEVTNVRRSSEEVTRRT